jgi:hypothetical protein
VLISFSAIKSEREKKRFFSVEIEALKGKRKKKELNSSRDF